MTSEDRIRIEPYDPDWPKRFLDEAMSLEGALRQWMVGSIEHIGSTAVPGLCAKPVIDIMIPVHSLEDSRPAIGVLERFGYGDDTTLMVAAYLHDVIEDTTLNRATIEALWGAKQGLIADLLTTPGAAMRVARTRRMLEKWKLTKRTPNSALAATGELADRIANAEASWATRHRMLFTYRDEHRGFRRALRSHTRDSEAAMWRHLSNVLGL